MQICANIVKYLLNECYILLGQKEIVKELLKISAKIQLCHVLIMTGNKIIIK